MSLRRMEELARKGWGAKKGLEAKKGWGVKKGWGAKKGLEAKKGWGVKPGKIKNPKYDMREHGRIKEIGEGAIIMYSTYNTKSKRKASTRRLFSDCEGGY